MASLPSLMLRQGKRKSVHARSAGKKERAGKGRVFGSSCLRYRYGKAGLCAKKNKTRSTQSDVRDEYSRLSQSDCTRCPDSIGISESGPSLDASSYSNQSAIRLQKCSRSPIAPAVALAKAGLHWMRVSYIRFHEND